MFFSLDFRTNGIKYKGIARRKGLRLDPYKMEDVKIMNNDDLIRIRDSVDNYREEWPEDEYAYYVSDFMIRTMIDSRKIKTFSTYKDVFLSNFKDQYLYYHEILKAKQPILLVGVGVVHLPDDYQDYLNDNVLYNYRQAQELGMIPQYFSGRGVFKEVESTRRVIYSDDYDDYIKNLSDQDYFKLLGENRQYLAVKHQDYKNASTFFITAMDQIEKYIVAIRPLEEPVYIPGDGIGIGSYVCRMLKKNYISSEPNNIGREAILIGLISYKNEYKEEDQKMCRSVFLGNVIKYIPNFKSLGMPVCQYDEQPIVDTKWYNGGDVRLWYNYPVIPVMSEMKIKFPRILRNLSEKHNFIPQDNLVKAAMQKYGLKQNDKEGLAVCTHPKAGQPSYCLMTRSFSYDLKHGRRGQMKDLGDMFEWVPDNVILDGYCGKVGLSEYGPVVMKVFDYDGDVIVSRQKYPRRMRYIQMGDERRRVTYVGTDPVTRKSSYMLNSEYCYKKDVT